MFSVSLRVYRFCTYMQAITYVYSRSQILKCYNLLFQCDLPQRQIDQLDIEAFYKENNFIGWTETSAKDGLMVNDSMQ